MNLHDECFICKKKESLTIKVLNHLYLGKKTKIIHCKECCHSFFPKVFDTEDFDEKFVNFYRDSKDLNPLVVKPKFFQPLSIRNYSIFNLIKVFTKLKKKLSLLEIGPGYPGIIYLFKKFISNYHDNSLFYSIESDTRSIQSLKKIGIENISHFFPNKYLEKYKDKFDIILSINSFYYFSDPIQSLKLINQILKKNGIFFLDIISDAEINSEYFERSAVLHVYSKKSLRKIANIIGMEIVFMEYSSEDNTTKKYLERSNSSLSSNLFYKLTMKVLRRLGFFHQNEIETHLLFSEDFDYINNDNGGRIRAIFKKK